MTGGGWGRGSNRTGGTEVTKNDLETIISTLVFTWGDVKEL